MEIIMNNPKLKRHRGLIPFSREHGLILVCAQRMRKAIRGTKKMRTKLVNEIKTDCLVQLSTSLQNEQYCFLPVIARTGLAHRFNYLHGKLCDLIDAFIRLDPEEDPGIGRVSMTSNALEDYVRWEQNYLFPTLEKLLSNEELERLGSSLQTTKQSHQPNRMRPGCYLKLQKLETVQENKMEKALVVK